MKEAISMGRYDLSSYTVRVLILLILPCVPLHAQHALAQEVVVIQQFIGSWEGQGELFGSKASFSMKWESVLGQQFVRLTFENGTKGPDGIDRTLQAVAFYKPIGEGRLEGTWFDSRGKVLPLQVSTEPTTLTTLWGTSSTEQGRTTYRLVDKGTIEVEDFVLKDDQWHQFGHATYQRVLGNQ